MTGPGHQEIEKEHKETMNKVAELLGGLFKGYGFTLLVFPFGPRDDGRMNYISNAQRPDMLLAMKEFIARHEGRSADSSAKH